MLDRDAAEQLIRATLGSPAGAAITVEAINGGWVGHVPGPTGDKIAVDAHAGTATRYPANWTTSQIDAAHRQGPQRAVPAPTRQANALHSVYQQALTDALARLKASSHISFAEVAWVKALLAAAATELDPQLFAAERTALRFLWSRWTDTVDAAAVTRRFAAALAGIHGLADPHPIDPAHRQWLPPGLADHPAAATLWRPWREAVTWGEDPASACTLATGTSDRSESTAVLCDRWERALHQIIEAHQTRPATVLVIEGWQNIVVAGLDDLLAPAGLLAMLIGWAEPSRTSTDADRCAIRVPAVAAHWATSIAFDATVVPVTVAPFEPVTSDDILDEVRIPSRWDELRAATAHDITQRRQAATPVNAFAAR